MLTLADAWVHSLNPVLVAIGPVKIRWYGLSYVLGFIIGAFLLRWLSGRKATPIPKDRVLDVIVWLVGGVLIGGRVGYAVLYQPHLLWGLSGSFPFWDMLVLQNGGMASHGAMLGTCVAAWRISKGWKPFVEPGSDAAVEVEGACSVWHVMDLVALIATPGIVLGRLANFVNGELLGRIVAGPGMSAPGWSVRYWQEALERWEQLPESQRALIAESAGVPVGPVVEGGKENEVFVNAAINHVMILGEQVQHGSTAAAQHLAELINARHPSQIYQALAEGVLTGAIVWWIARKPRVPGLVGAWFLIVYGIGRVLTELVRLPDFHLVHERLLGLSRGQWLSVGMVAIGSGLLWLTTKGPWRTRERMLGWEKPKPQ